LAAPRYPEVRPISQIVFDGRRNSRRRPLPKEIPMNHAHGTFTVDIHPLSPSPAEGIGRFSINKTIHGELAMFATSQHAHFIGIGGIGMSGIAEICSAWA
jgi:hypothetical protein